MTIRHPRRRAIIAVVAAAALAIPATAVAGHVFDDVGNDAFYASAVSWAKANGITNGCNPSQGNTRYCPDDTVTRGTMAVFLRNLASSRAVDAGTLDGLNSTAFLRTTGTATNADKLDGLDAAAFRTIVARVTESTVVAIDGGCDSHSSVMIDVPVAGTIIVEADVNLRHDHVDNGQPSGAFLYLDTSVTGCTAETRPDFHRTAAIVDVSEPAGTKYEQAHVSRQFDVAAGTHTFHLNAQTLFGTAATRFDSSALQAIFYPG